MSGSGPKLEDEKIICIGQMVMDGGLRIEHSRIKYGIIYSRTRGTFVGLADLGH